MSEHSQRFIAYLQDLRTRDRGAMAALRRSLAFEPGCHVPTFPVVERFIGRAAVSKARRQALYLTAGLFALHPQHQTGVPIGRALAEHLKRHDSGSLEKRFIALLTADVPALPTHLRHAVQLLAADERGLDFAALLDDLSVWLDEWQPDRSDRADPRDQVRQRWALNYYRLLATRQPNPHDHAEDDIDSVEVESSDE